MTTAPLHPPAMRSPPRVISRGGRSFFPMAEAMCCLAGIRGRHAEDPADLDTFPGNGYGYGVFVEPFYDLTIRQHGGNIWGWGSYLLWHPERRFAVAVLANTFQSLPSAAYCIADAVLEPDHSAAPEYPADPDRWEIFEGAYDVSLRASISPNPYPGIGEVSIEGGGRLVLELWIPESAWYEAWILDHAGLDVFYVDVDGDDVYDLDLSFLTSDGTPERLRWMRMRPVVGNSQVAPRGGGRRSP